MILNIELKLSSGYDNEKPVIESRHGSILIPNLDSEGSSDFGSEGDIFAEIGKMTRTKSFQNPKPKPKFKQPQKRFSIKNTPSMLSMESPCFGTKYFK